MFTLSGCNNYYLLLIIFSHLDPKSLFGSCSRVCKEWYSIFFSTSSSSLDKQENFNSSLIKICYLNTTCQRMELHRQEGDFANDNFKSHFIKLDGGGNSKVLKLFNQILKMEYGRKLKNAKKMLTINSGCKLIPYHREAMDSIRQFHIGENSYRISSIDIFETNNPEHQLAVCYPFMVYSDNSELKIISLVSGKQFCTHLFNSNFVIQQIEFKFHSQMQQYYKSKLQIDAECYIYSLYILGCTVHQNHSIKRFLLIDQLFGEIKLIEDCTFMEEALMDSCYNIKVGDWDTNTIDVVLLKHEHFFSLFLQDGYKVSFVTADHYNNNPYVPMKGEYPIIPIQLPSWRPGCFFLDINIVNITKPLMREGISLINSEKYSMFSVFEVKICYQVIHPIDFESEIFCNSIYILVAKKYEPTVEANPYSIMWKVCKRKDVESLFQMNVRKVRQLRSTSYPEIKDLGNYACFLDQGRKLKLITSFYGYDYLYGLVEYIDLVDYWEWNYTVYPSWNYLDSYSIGDFVEDDLKQTITKEISQSRRNWKIIGHAEDNFYILLDNTRNGLSFSVCVVNYDNFKENRNPLHFQYRHYYR